MTSGVVVLLSHHHLLEMAVFAFSQSSGVVLRTIQVSSKGLRLGLNHHQLLLVLGVVLAVRVLRSPWHAPDVRRDHLEGGAHVGLRRQVRALNLIDLLIPLLSISSNHHNSDVFGVNLLSIGHLLTVLR